MKLLRMEFFKCRRRKIALICLAFVAVQLAWMGRTLTQMEPGELTQGWMSLQAVPLAVGIFGSFVGLFALFFPQWVQRCVIWGYYGVLIQAGMNWDPVTRATEFYWVQTRPLEFGLLALWMIVVLAVGRGLFVRKEV